MKKNKKAKIAIITGIVLFIVLCAIILVPRIIVWYRIGVVYEESIFDELGETVKQFTKYEVTDDSLVRVTFPNFSIELPAYFEDRSREDSEITIYKAADATEENYFDYEGISFNSEGADHSDFFVSYWENISSFEMSRLMRGCEKLGYGMPDNDYNNLKVAFSITKEDYNFWNYDTSLAYMYLLTVRLNMIPFSYFYETEDKCAIIREKGIEDNGLYFYTMEVFDSKDLNTGYAMSMSVRNPETAYAIINSIQFQKE